MVDEHEVAAELESAQQSGVDQGVSHVEAVWRETSQRSTTVGIRQYGCSKRTSTQLCYAISDDCQHLASETVAKVLQRTPW